MRNYSQKGAASQSLAPSLAPERMAAASRALGMREAYSNGVRCKGFKVTIVSGASNFTVDLSGMARNFLGFAYYFLTAPAGAVTAQLVINNDVVVDSTLIQHFLVNGATSDRDYYPFPRPLNGQDTIVFNFNNAGANADGYLVAYYI
jgi:hypothetical protein